jgi:diadenosine tetraphosphatase ApaH/serine/threonine PP2A family protein phosphatase
MAERIAIISDVHGNAMAFRAVLEDVRERGIDWILNLGDAIGYGPEPEQCIDLAAEHCRVNLCGNHEYAVMHGAEGFNPVARGAVEFVRNRLDPRQHPEIAEAPRRWEFLQNLPAYYQGEGFLAMHGSPRHAVMEYVLPSDPEVDPLKIDDIFDCMEMPLAFVGHTHFPGIVEDDAGAFIGLPALGEIYAPEPGRKAVVNVGSVGQPRDRDIRSCYVEFDGEQVFFRRVGYDVEETVRKIQESGGLHESLGLRLREGR